MEIMQVSEEQSQANSSSSQTQRQEIVVEELTLGKGPFQRDPLYVVAAPSRSAMVESSKKLRHQQLLMLLSRRLKTEVIDKQSCSSDTTLLEENKDTSSSCIVNVKRKAEASDILSNKTKKTASASNINSEKKWLCSLCGISSTSEKGFEDHLRGKKHKNKEASSKFNDPTKNITTEGNSNRLYCSLCQKYIPSEKRLKAHLEGKKHKAKEAKVNVSSASTCSKEMSNNDTSCLSNIGKSLERDESHKDEEDSSELVLGFDKQNGKEETKKEVMLYNKSWHCEMCNVTCVNEEGMNLHRRGSEHMSLLEKNRGAIIVVSMTPVEETL